MNYAKDAFETMSRGRFITSNSLDDHERMVYNDIEENLEEYNAFFGQLGLFIECGQGYFLLCRKESRVDLERKVQNLYAWLRVFDFLCTFDTSLGVGYEFRKVEIEERMHDQIEFREKGQNLFESITRYSDIAEKLVSLLRNSGYIELVDTATERYRVTTAIRYMEELVASLTIEENEENETAQ